LTTQHDERQPPTVLEALLEPLKAITLTCPICAQVSPVAPPFDLLKFQCPNCKTHLYPLVQVHERTLDLLELRALIVSAYHSYSVCSAALEAMSKRPSKGRSIDPQLVRKPVAAHCLSAAIRHTHGLIHIPAALLGIVHPVFLGWIPIAIESSKKERRDTTLRSALLEGPLSLRAFDPSGLPWDTDHALIAETVEKLALEDGATDVLFAPGFEGLYAFGSEERSWTIALDKRKSLDERHEERVSAGADAFTASVAKEFAAIASGQDATCRSVQRLILVDGRNLIKDHPLIKAGTPVERVEDGIVREAVRDPGFLDHVTPYMILESRDYGSGAITRSFLRCEVQGPLIAARWTTLIRQPAAQAVYLHGDLVDPDSAAVERRIREETMRQYGSISEKVSRMVPSWVVAATFTGVLSSLLWYGIASVLGAQVEIVGRAAYAVLWALAIMASIRRKRKPFPRTLWRDSQFSWSELRQRRKERLAEEIRREVAKFDYSSSETLEDLPGVKVMDRLGQMRVTWNVYAHDRLVQEAVLSVAESLGFDTSEYKKGIQQINNYGVMAERIEGPVAAGRGAKVDVREMLSAPLRAVAAASGLGKTEAFMGSVERQGPTGKS
jgi:hypothetical protein